MFSQSFGSLPWSIERWNMMVSAGARWSAHCFKTLFGMLSGPDSLEGFIFLMSFATPSCVVVTITILSTYGSCHDNVCR